MLHLLHQRRPLLLPEVETSLSGANGEYPYRRSKISISRLDIEHYERKQLKANAFIVADKAGLGQEHAWLAQPVPMPMHITLR